MTPSQKILARLGLKEEENIEQPLTGNNTEEQGTSRRNFLKRSALGGIALGSAFALSPIEDLIAQSTQKVSRYSGPSDLKITDMRYCLTAVMGGTALIPTRVSMAWVKYVTLPM
ncbi:MAG TPA: twin-arginine translocation signal domain-containing protein [Chitinophagaceae bacterium]|nr:twin-arginine translocation signal domain-containing protein [Chitinophagaceae bacterium]